MLDKSLRKLELSKNKLINSKFLRNFLHWYGNFFSIREIKNSLVLRWFAGYVIFATFVVFFNWVYNNALTIQAVVFASHRCWPYFQNCGDWYFLSALPYGFSQNILYMLFFGFLVLSVYLVYKRNYILIHPILMFLFIWEFLVLFVLSSAFRANYYYYAVILTFVFLFLPYKLFFLRLVFVIMYFLASTVKINEGWILGTYFSSMVTGLPIFPDALTPIFTNIAIIMEMIGSWFLLSSNKYLQRSVLSYFIVFHLYSITLVQYRYPSIVLPALLILFGPEYHSYRLHFNKKIISGFLFIFFMITAQVLSFTISGKIVTMEGNYYGLYMFEANHQCISTSKIYAKNGTLISSNTDQSASARSRCDPYNEFFRLKQVCKRSPEKIGRIEWIFDHSINGGPFYRIVDEKNVCFLKYNAFKHNEWIKLPEKAKIVGYPAKNIYK